MTDDLGARLRAGAAAGEPPLPDVAAAAEAAGLLDIGYATLDTAVGRLLLTATPAGLLRIFYLDEEAPESHLAGLAARVSPRVLADARRLEDPRRQLAEYFEGRRRSFALALDRRLLTGFGRRVLDATASIPYGETSTYQQVARQAGSPRGSRAAGNALGANPLPIVLPCHRVLHSGGGLGGYTGGVERKRILLAIEQGDGPLDGRL